MKMKDNITTSNKQINQWIRKIREHRVELPYEEVRKISMKLDLYGEKNGNERLRLFANYHLIEAAVRNGSLFTEKDFHDWVIRTVYFARLLKEPEYLISAKNIEGIYYSGESDYILAVGCYKEAYQNTIDYNLPKLRGKLLSNIGIIYYQMEDYHTTLSYFNEAKKYVKLDKTEAQEQVNFFNRSVMKYYEAICLIRTERIEEASELIECFKLELVNRKPRTYYQIGVDLADAFILLEKGEIEQGKAVLVPILTSEERMKELKVYQMDCLIFIDLLFKMNCKPQQIKEVLDQVEEDLMDDSETQIREKYLVRKLGYYDLVQDPVSYKRTLGLFFEARREDEKNEGERIFRAIQIRKELKQLKEEQYTKETRGLEKLSQVTQDELTGLLNRRFLSNHMEDIVNEARTRHQILTVGMIDIDRFRALNLRYGLEVGDQCMREVAGILEKLQSEDVKVIRLTGDKFLVVASNYKYAKLRAVTEFVAMEVEKIEPPITVSQGWVARIPEPQIKSWDYIVKAEKYLRRAKLQGQNKISILW